MTDINHEHMGTSLDDLAYTYDTLARVHTFSTIDGTATYGYDPTSQLTSTTYVAASGHTEPPNFAIAFDPNGNRSTVNGTSATISANNEVTDDGTFTYQFDPEGNRTVRTRDSSASAPDYKTTYSWDYRDRLDDVENFDNNGVLTQHVHYVYDVWNHLIERDVDPNGSGTYTLIVHYVWDATAPPVLVGASQPPDAPGNIVFAFNGQQQLTTRYLNGPNTSARDQFFSTLAEEDVNSLTSPGTVAYDLLDDEGTLTDIIDANGVLQDHLTYTPFGQVFSETNPSIGHIAGYAGGLYDPVTQNVYFIHRWYDPSATVWLGFDPSGFAAGDANLGRYVVNDPTNAVDPTGLVDAPFPGADKSATSPRNPALQRGASFGSGPGTWKWGANDGPFIAQRVTIEGRLQIVDSCGLTHTVMWKETYVEVWSRSGTNQESHKTGPKMAADYLAKHGNFGYSTHGGGQLNS